MYKPQNFARFGTAIGSLIVSSLICGCEKTESSAKYRVPKHDSLQSTEFLSAYEKSHPKPERMFGLVLPKGSMLWFFKLQGNLEATAARESTLREFLKSLSFPSDEKPEWNLPAGWRQLPGNEMRYATIVLDGEPPLELTVTKFPSRPEISVTEQLLMNINRWRGQLSLPPIDTDDLAERSEKLTVGGDIGYWIEIIGRPQPKGGAMAPPPPQATKADPKPDRPTATSAPEFDKPEGWSEGPAAMFATVSLQATEGDAKALITVTPAGGNKLLNVNRWRGQIGLGPLTEEELASTAKKVVVGELTGDLYEMVESDRAIFGVIVEGQGQMWFVKMIGDAPVVQRESGHFEEFLKSLRL